MRKKINQEALKKETRKRSKIELIYLENDHFFPSFLGSL